ncbi:hypothetical protein F5Y12DRAFT_742309 [Xylaria sp. FL1777]|nr:hypothetical protein F5Y12DRAFT_742309 [Xylaria sp. FL1777]
MAADYEAPCLQDAEEPVSLKYQHRRSSPISLVALVKFVFTFLIAFGIGYTWRGIMRQELRLSKDPFREAAVPPAPRIPILFSEQPLYADAPTQASNSAWEDLIPKGRGFIEVTDSGGSNRYCVSAFHQLHCLDMLRHGYYAAVELVNQKSDLKAITPVNPAAHMQHCFDYLRQALMCAADPTLEIRNESISGVTGWGSTHQCRNFEALKQWTEQHRYNDEGGIEN